MNRFANFVALALLSTFAFAQSTDSTEPDEERNIAGYDPKLWASVLGIVVYGATAAVQWFHLSRNRGNKYMMTLTIGMTCMVMGFILRIIYAQNVSSVTIYAIMTLFLLLSPCAFLATNYLLLSRLAAALGAESALFIRASRVVKIFVWADVVTFLFQAAGGGMSSIQDLADTGHKIALIGLALQLVSFGLFCILLIVFGIRVPRMFPEISRQIMPLRLGSLRIFSTESINDWRALYVVLVLSSVGIICRSIFRLIEYTQGYSGYIPTHEIYFYLLDALPLWIAMTFYAILWPPRVIEGAKSIAVRDSTSISSPSSGQELNLKGSESPTTTTDWRRTDIEMARNGRLSPYSR